MDNAFAWQARATPGFTAAPPETSISSFAPANIRSSTADELERLTPPRVLSLDQAMEFVREDECVEVTPGSVRMRKLVLPKVQRLKTARLARR